MKDLSFQTLRKKTIGLPLLGFLISIFSIPSAYTQNVFYHLLPHAIAPFTWVGLAADANWTSPQNWSSGVVPGAGNTAIFDENCSINCSATINANISIGGMLIKNSYSGTITQGAGNTITIGSAGWTQSTGTFVGGNSQFTLTDGFINLSGNASFTATTGQTYFNHSIAHGNFNIISLAATNTLIFPDNSTAKFTLPGDCGSPHFNIVSPVKVSFYNLVMGSTGTGCGAAVFGNTAATTEIRNDFSYITAADAISFTGNYDVYGNISSVISLSSDAVWYTKGATNTTYEGPGGVNYLVVNKTGGATVTPKAGTVLFNVNGISILSGGFTFPTTLNIVKRNYAPYEWFKIASGTAVVTPSNSTVNLNAWGDCGGPNYLIDVDTTYSFENLTIIGSAAGCGNAVLTAAPGDTIIVKKSFTPSNLVAINFNVNLEGNLLAGTGNPFGTMGVTFQNTVAETAAMNTAFTTGNWNVNKTSGTVTLQTDTLLTTAGQDLDITSGILNMNGKNLTINDTLTIAANGKLICNAGTISAATYVLVGEFSCGTTLGITWTGATGDHLWTTAGNWTNNNVPGINDIAVFNGRCTGANCNVTVNTNVSVKGFKFYSSYPGTFSQGTYTLTAGSSGWNQSGGTFSGGSANISVNGTFDLNGGTYTATSGTTSIGTNLSISVAAGNFIHNSGTFSIIFNGNQTHSINSGNVVFDKLTFTGNGYQTVKNITGSMIVTGTFTCDSTSSVGSLNGGSISVLGNASFTNNGCNGTTLVDIAGSGNQSVTGVSTANIPNFRINSTGGTVSLFGTLVMARDFTYTAGTVNAGTSNVYFPLPDSFSANITSTTALALYDVTFRGSGYNSTRVINGTLVSTGLLTLESTSSTASVTNGTIQARGNVTYLTNGLLGTALIEVAGSTNQSVTGVATALSPPFKINSSGGTVSLLGTLHFSLNFIYAAGTVDSGTSTVIFEFTSWTNPTITTNNSMVFNNVTFQGNGYGSNTTLTGNMVVAGNFTCGATNNSTGVISTGTISVRGNLNFTDNGCWGTTTVEAVGTTNQTITSLSTAFIPNFKINSTGGIVTLVGSLRFKDNFTYQAGTVDSGTSTVIFEFTSWTYPTLTTNNSMVFNNVTFQGSGYATNDTLVGNMVIGGTLSCDANASGPGQVNGGTISLRGNASFTNYGCDGTALIEVVGTGNQTISGVSTAIIQSFKINSTGGTVTFSGSPRFYRDFNYVAGTIDPGTSTVIFEFQPSATNTLTLSTSIPFNNVTIQGNGGSATKTLVGTMLVNGNFICNSTSSRGNVNTGLVSVRGNVTLNTNGCGGTALLSLDGASSTTLSMQSSAATPFMSTSISVNKSGGASVTLVTDAPLPAGQAVNITGGTLNLGGYTLSTTVAMTVGTGTTLFCNGGEFTSGSVTNNGTINCPGYAPYGFHWTGAGGDSNWNTAANWSGSTVPGANDMPVFSNAFCGATCNANINVGVSVRGLRLFSDYTGTITQASGSTIAFANQGYNQKNGTFTGSNAAISDNGNFTQSGGVFNAPSTLITLAKNFTVSGASVFNAGTSTLNFTGTGTTLISAGTPTYNNVILAAPIACNTIDLSAGTFKVGGSLTLGSHTWCTGNPRPINNGTINVGGDVTLTNLGYTGNATINLTGNAAGQTIYGLPTATLPGLKITAGANPVTFNGVVRVAYNFTMTSVGTFNVAGSTLEFISDSVIIPGTVTYNNVSFPFAQACAGFNFSGGNMKVGGNLTMDGTGWCGGLRPMNNGTVSVNGNISVANSGYNGTAVIAAVGNTSGQTITGIATATIPNLTINVGANLINLSGSILVNNATVVTSGALDMAGAGLKTLSLALNGNTLTKNAGILIVNGTTVGTGSLYGGTVAP